MSAAAEYWKAKVALPRETKQAQTLVDAIGFYCEKRLADTARDCNKWINANPNTPGVIYRTNFRDIHERVKSILLVVMEKFETITPPTVELIARIVFEYISVPGQPPGVKDASYSIGYDLLEIVRIFEEKQKNV